MNKNQELALKEIKLAQFTYKLGYPLFEDSVYDTMVKNYNEQYPTEDLNLYWEDISEEEGMELIREFNLWDMYIQYLTDAKDYSFNSDEYLEITYASDDVINRYLEYKTDRNRSIPIVKDSKTVISIFQNFKSHNVSEYILSLKLDGWNITVYVEDEEIVYAHQRAKQGNMIDVTSIIKHILSKRDISLKGVKRGYFVGELILRNEHLHYLRDKYNKKFKTTRNSIASFVNNKVTKDDLKLSDLVVFYADFEGITFKKQSDMFEYLTEVGFEVPHYKVTPGEAKEAFEVFIDMSEKINQLPPSDGVVIQPNVISEKESILQLPIFPEVYNVGIYAFKLGNWGEQVLKSVILDISYTRNTKSIKPSLKIEPVRTFDGREITTVPVDHIGRLVDEDLYVGKEIMITVVSEKDIRLAYNKEKANLRLNL